MIANQHVLEKKPPCCVIVSSFAFALMGALSLRQGRRCYVSLKQMPSNTNYFCKCGIKGNNLPL